MAEKKTKTQKQVKTLTHGDAARKNIPTAEYQALIEKEQTDPLRVAYERRNPDLDPQLIWRGKDMQDWSDLVVHAPPLYIQEKVHPKVLIDDLKKCSVARGQCSDPGAHEQIEFDLFGDFNGIPEGADKTEFYAHDQNWSNRMILGDSLQVMASLAEREALRGKVQCIYFDPPYGIKFNSNFQWSTTSRDVKDGNKDHITREPEQVKAFRDTWRDGIHSYLTYLRDRFTVARELLTDSGSIFVQIGDENVHRVRSLLDEVFGEDNFVSQITVRKTTSEGNTLLGSTCDFVLWFGKHKENTKAHTLYAGRSDASEGRYTTKYFDGSLYRLDNITSSRPAGEGDVTKFRWFNREFTPGKGTFKTKETGLMRLGMADRFLVTKNGKLNYRRSQDDFGYGAMGNLWADISGAVQSRSDPKVYVVQTSTSIIGRCLLLTTDPGDLVLDPTCGSGTTAYVAEQWGRRWITIDTSRVALALARARIMGARYPYYLLADSPEGKRKEAEVQGRALVTSHSPLSTPSHAPAVRQGFVYERVPHITLKSIANNAEIDVIWERWQPEITSLLEQLSAVIGEEWIVNSRKKLSTDHTPLSAILAEWEVPRERPSDWPPATQPLLTAFWQARIERQRKIDASIAAKADSEYLYDKPYEDNKTVRVAGPFTVESLSPHRVLGLDEDDELLDEAHEEMAEYKEGQNFAAMIIENLRTAGVQQAHKADKIDFISLTGWPGKFICAEGRYTEGNKENGATKRAGIFIGPEFGTVSRPDLVEAAREAAESGFDVLIACAFNFEARTTEFNKLGAIPVLKARMNADLHMAEDLKNTGKGNLFVIFGEPDITVAGEEWIVDRNKERIAPYEILKLVSGTDGLAEINGLDCGDLQHYAELSCRGEIWNYLADAAGRLFDTGEHRRGTSSPGNGGVSSVARHCAGIAGGIGNVCDTLRKAGVLETDEWRKLVKCLCGNQQNASRADARSGRSKITKSTNHHPTIHQPLSTNHYLQLTVNGVDVFHPNTGEVRSDGAEGIACWFIDTDYNEESFFVRHAYFLGQNDPYQALKTSLKAEINAEAWETLNSAVSRPFDKPKDGRIAVKVINHLGDEVMKVFRV